MAAINWVTKEAGKLIQGRPLDKGGWYELRQLDDGRWMALELNLLHVGTLQECKAEAEGEWTDLMNAGAPEGRAVPPP
jgi:hypothetical protein